jgi:hypothetical protein
VLTWTRDPVEVYAFHVDVPEARSAIEARMVHTPRPCAILKAA